MDRRLLVVLLLGACAEDATAGVDAALPDAQAEALRCALTAPFMCSRTPGCQPIEGRRFDELSGCVGEQRALACVAAPFSCPPSIRHARDSAGKAWQFVSGCVPEGYAEFSPDEQAGACSAAQVPGACAALSLDNCGLRQDCKLLRGSPYAGPRCSDVLYEHACIDASTPCASRAAFARDPDGAEWEFFSDCTPAGWTRFDAPAVTLCRRPYDE